MHQFEHALLARLWEVLLHVELADGLAQHVAHERHGTLPARAVLFDTRHHLAELKLHLAEGVAHLRCGTADDLRFGIGLQVVEGRVGQDLLHLVERLGLSEVHAVEGGIAAGQEDGAPVDAGIVAEELGEGELVVVALDVAQLHAVIARLGDARLDGEHGLHLLLGRGLVAARHGEELLEIRLVSLQHTLVLCIVGEVVVARAQAQSALSHVDDVPLGVLLVGGHAQAVHHRVLAVAVKLSRHQLVLLAVLDGRDLGQRRLDDGVALAVHARGVHHEVVERSDLLSQ